MGDSSAAHRISRQVGGGDWDRQQNQDTPWAAKALYTTVGVKFPMIAYRSEKSHNLCRSMYVKLLIYSSLDIAAICVQWQRGGTLPRINT